MYPTVGFDVVHVEQDCLYPRAFRQPRAENGLSRRSCVPIYYTHSSREEKKLQLALLPFMTYVTACFNDV